MAKFEPGQSGNPSGRPPGIRDRRGELRDKLASHADELIAKVVDLAKGGDVSALRLVLERLVPPAKAKDDPIELPAMLGATLADCGQAVLTALAEGRISPEEAATVMGALSGQARVIETSEIDKRLRALEEAAAKRGTK